MSPPDPDALFAALRHADPEVMDRDALAELASVVKSQRAWLDSLQVRITRRQRALADQGRAEAPKDLLAREGGQSGRDARTADDREKVCTALPSFEDALAGGAVSAGHVDALALTPDRIATWTRPDGTVFHTGTTIDRAPNGVAPPSPTEAPQLELVS